jgi:hypothetical protein
VTLPAETIFTAEFVQKVEDLFDSLNNANSKPVDHKRFRCALLRNSPHFDLNKIIDKVEQVEIN